MTINYSLSKCLPPTVDRKSSPLAIRFSSHLLPRSVIHTMDPMWVKSTINNIIYTPKSILCVKVLI